jgi:hypothetical protein
MKGVAHVFNPSYLGRRGRKIAVCGWLREKVSKTQSQNKPGVVDGGNPSSEASLSKNTRPYLKNKLKAKEVGARLFW